jgi:hypothetical protein
MVRKNFLLLTAVSLIYTIYPMEEQPKIAHPKPVQNKRTVKFHNHEPFALNNNDFHTLNLLIEFATKAYINVVLSLNLDSTEHASIGELTKISVEKLTEIEINKQIIADAVSVVLKDGGYLKKSIPLPMVMCSLQGTRMVSKNEVDRMFIDGPILESVQEIYNPPIKDCYEDPQTVITKPPKPDNQPILTPELADEIFMPDLKRGFFNQEK